LETFPDPISWLGMEKLNLTQKHTSPIKRNVLQHKINTKKLNPGLVTSYDIRPECLLYFDTVGWAAGIASGM